MMTAATAMLAGGAFAACTLPTEDRYCAQVYEVKVSLKTTVGKTKVDCEEVCYRNKGSAKLKGYLYTCDCSCTGLLTSALYLYDKATDAEYFGFPSWAFLSRIGKKNKDAEAHLIAPLYTTDGLPAKNGGEVYFLSGFGKFDSDGRLKEMSGNIVGMRYPPYCEEDCSIGSFAFAYPWCYLEQENGNGNYAAQPYYVQTVGYGSWSIRYNKKLSEKYAAGLWIPPTTIFD
jgi:hypothetical protein